MRYFNWLFSLLLLYIIAALVFWGISLQKQSTAIFEQQVISLNHQTDSTVSPFFYQQKIQNLIQKKDARTKQYIGEGLTSLFIIFIGASIVYRSFKKNAQLSKQQNNFMLAVTHELKSPIASIKLNLQTIQKHQLNEVQQNKMLQGIASEIERLNDLCNNILFVSQIDSKHYQQFKEEQIWSNLAINAITLFQSRYPNRLIFHNNCHLEKIVCDPLLITLSLNNLIENALKYAPSNTPISIKIDCINSQAYFSVADLGIGISPEEKTKIWDKFYRSGDERTRQTKGTGLGLYLTSKIIKQHGGKIAVKDNIPNGSIFEIWIPLK